MVVGGWEQERDAPSRPVCPVLGYFTSTDATAASVCIVWCVRLANLLLIVELVGSCQQAVILMLTDVAILLKPIR